MPWFVKLEEGVVDRSRFDNHLHAHLAWIQRLEQLGHRPSTGYWGERKGMNLAGAGGMLLFVARDRAEAEAIVLGDPLIQTGCVRWVLHEWRIVAGELRGDAPPTGPGAESTTGGATCGPEP